MVTDTKTMSEIVQEALGTTFRNRAILALYREGMKKSDVARQFTVNEHLMTRQQVGQIIDMMLKAKENHGITRSD